MAHPKTRAERRDAKKKHPATRGAAKKRAAKKRAKKSTKRTRTKEPAIVHVHRKARLLDTVVIDCDVARGTTIDINVQTAIEFWPEYFIYTGTPGAFLIRRVFVAHGPNSNFGGGYLADLHDGKRLRLAWPTFYVAPPLTITVENISGGAARFAGVLVGEERGTKGLIDEHFATKGAADADR